VGFRREAEMTAEMIFSKTAQPQDVELAPAARDLVNQYFTQDREQHPIRRWEYLMALRALDKWTRTTGNRGFAPINPIDVGGAGSPFYRMVEAITVIDPEINTSLEDYTLSCPRLSQAIFCLSVLEHVEHLDRFCYYLDCLLAPGGLLFFTVDYCDTDEVGWPVDRYHFHWMRKRIFHKAAVRQLRTRFSRCYPFGGTDELYYGHQVYDYSVASIALIKEI
jgi:hypothetical protein